MNEASTIRPIAICVFRQGNKILVEVGFDHTEQAQFYRPTGGGIHFGEPSDIAIRREIREELGAELENPKLLGVLENLFTLEGEPGHEVVFVYDAEFKDKTLYEMGRLEGRESNGECYDAVWIDLESLGPDTPPLYPDDLLRLLSE